MATRDNLAHILTTTSPDDLSRGTIRQILQAGTQIKANLSREPGLSKTDHEILMFFLGEQESPYQELISAALLIAKNRRRGTATAMDNCLISDAVTKVKEEIERYGHDELSDQDREILQVAETLDTDAGTNISISPSMLSDINQVFQSLNLGSKSLDELNDAEQVHLASFMHQRADRFIIKGDKFPLPPRMPALPTHTELSMSDLPDSLEVSGRGGGLIVFATEQRACGKTEN
ncbi:hypothetical protein ACHAP5_011131 [Fusarium lateritium]